jgi:small subunit ribosomal protein S16
VVTIRLSRHGSKKHPYYHVVVSDHERPRDGRFIEQIGTYDPNQPMAEARIDVDRLGYWLGVGAQPSESLAKVLREHKKALDAAQAKASA